MSERKEKNMFGFNFDRRTMYIIAGILLLFVIIQFVANPSQLIGLLLRILMVPLTAKTMKQSENMKKAQPELERLEKKYKDKTDSD